MPCVPSEGGTFLPASDCPIKPDVKTHRRLAEALDQNQEARLGLFRPPRKGTLRYMRWQDRITVTPGVRSGKPCIKGTRITVYDVLEYLAGGMTEAQILADFSDLTAKDIRACLAFAATRERRLAGSSAV